MGGTQNAAAKLNTADYADLLKLIRVIGSALPSILLVWMQGGSLFTSDGMANLNSEEVVNALQLWKDLLDSETVMRHLEDLFPDISILTNGETAMQINGSWSVLRVDSEKVWCCAITSSNGRR